MQLRDYQEPDSHVRDAVRRQFLVEGDKAAGLPVYFEKFSIRQEKEFLDVRGVCNGKKRRFIIGFLDCLDGRFYIYCVAHRRHEDLKTLFVGPPHPEDKHYNMGSIYAELDCRRDS